MECFLREAQSCLEDALAYSVALPRTAIRVRFFCCSSLFFACRTLALIQRKRTAMVAGARIKMPRREVYGILALTVLCAPFNGALRGLFQRLSPRLEQAAAQR